MGVLLASRRSLWFDCHMPSRHVLPTHLALDIRCRHCCEYLGYACVCVARRLEPDRWRHGIAGGDIHFYRTEDGQWLFLGALEVRAF